MLFKIIQQVMTILCPKKKSFSIEKAGKKTPYQLDRHLFSPCALKVIERLQQNGYQAFFVGGCLRDILLGYHPKDFDVVTNARPDQIARIFSNALIIGRRFTLVHVRFRNEIVEVATFRREHKEKAREASTEIIVDDNHYGTLEDDVIRRDFSMNALYYDPINKIMIDHIGGLNDLKEKTLKTIGDDAIRFSEDPVRMIRALRYAAKLNLKLTSQIKAGILAKGSLVLHVPKARLYEEFLKCFSQQNAPALLAMMNSLKFSRYLIPKVVIASGKEKKIGSMFQWLNRQEILKEHYATLILLCFIVPLLKDLNENKTHDMVIKILLDFQKLILVPKQVEYAIRNIVLNEKTPENIRMRIKPIPDIRRLKNLAQELLVKCQ
jgi:poly(A) polymerase